MRLNRKIGTTKEIAKMVSWIGLNIYNEYRGQEIKIKCQIQNQRSQSLFTGFKKKKKKLRLDCDFEN